ncbi:flagellar protein FlgN [Senegalia massiliensis]|uniref:flagellar protein FlgN n=1 Tax=Senegalia massiliensis TaxID=1720316 RepID=UPI0010315B59|nr:flagellar protein FlgN [Senegalia massiliensis]
MEVKIEKLNSLLSDKKILLEDFFKLTIVQKKLIENNDIDKLNRIINNKENLIEKINGLDVKFLEIYNNIKEIEGIDDLSQLSIDKSYLVKLKELTSKCEKLMKSIKAQDDENNTMIKSEFEDIKKNLREIKRGKTTTNKYYNKMPSSGGYFIDSKK